MDFDGEMQERLSKREPWEGAVILNNKTIQNIKNDEVCFCPISGCDAEYSSVQTLALHLGLFHPQYFTHCVANPEGTYQGNYR